MLPIKLQIFLALFSLVVLISCVALVLGNYEEPSSARYEERLFHQKGAYSKVLETNFVVFFATLISTSREVLLLLIERLLNKRVSPLLVGLANVTVKMICLTLFDFRVIHIHNTLIATRYTILVADITSLLLAESFHKLSQP